MAMAQGPAEPGNAIQFNGSSGFASVNQMAPTGSVTLMAWVQPNVLNNTSSFFGNQGLIGYRTNFNFYILMLPNGRMEYRATLGGQSVTITSDEVACIGGWSHVAMVYHQPTGQVTAYFNGLVAGTGTTAAVNLPQNSDPFRLGRQTVSGNNFWYNGRMDNAAMINRALTQEEVIHYAFQDVPEDDVDVVLYYKMNQSSGTSITAETGPNAALSGGYTWVESGFSVVIPEGSNAFVESPIDDGSVVNDAPFHFVIYNGTFNAELGDDLIADEKAVLTNLPEGLGASLVVIDGQTAVLSITGQALANDVDDSVSNAELRLITGALNEHCGWLGYPVSFTFIECLVPEIELNATALTVCLGDPVTLTASGAANYLWDDGSDGETFTFTPSETTTVELLASNDDGCGAVEAAITIAVVEAQEITVTPDENITICPGSNLTLTAGSGFDTYLWNTGSPGASIEVTSEGTFSVTATDANGCIAQSNEVSVDLHQVQVPVILIDGSAVLCEDASITLFVEGEFTNYLWNFGAEDELVTVTSAGDYFVIATDENGCVTTSETVSIEQSTLGDYTFDGPASVDENSTEEYTLSGDDVTVNWDVTGGSVVAEDPSGITVLWGGAGTGAVSFTLTNADGCVFGPFTEEVVINVVIGVSERGQEKPRAYPNPVSDVLMLDLVDHPAGRPCQVIDATGRVVETIVPSATPYAYSVSHLAGGVYFITAEDRAWVVRFVK